MTDTPYTADFYKSDSIARSSASARRIVPILRSLLPIQSVLDVGCGRGDFLRAFLDAGVTDGLGLDGDYVPRDQLVIDPSAFRPTDLAQGFDLGQRYDLVVSLEVAEHLPASAAEAFVAALVQHGDVVLFSAAIPSQGGTGHVNEQWPSYWAKAFAQHGLKPYDVIRPLIWSDEEVAFWYRQNVLLYATDSAAARSALSSTTPVPAGMIDLVHPRLYLMQADLLRSGSAQLTSLQTLLRSATSFDVEHTADGRIIVRRKPA
jgi:SAM-dependent methyltransferase